MATLRAADGEVVPLRLAKPAAVFAGSPRPAFFVDAQCPAGRCTSRPAPSRRTADLSTGFRRDRVSGRKPGQAEERRPGHGAQAPVDGDRRRFASVTARPDEVRRVRCRHLQFRLLAGQPAASTMRAPHAFHLHLKETAIQPCRQMPNPATIRATKPAQIGKILAQISRR